LSEIEEIKVQPVPGDKVKIINRLLQLQADYEIHSMNISSQPEKLIIEMTIKDH